ncbi:MAG: TlpA family protein disulfide reductase [Deltaproteobacteria bacterium]|nr:TlpA family protein disulfide reductase [Deltaproteobacteria bacterium]
MFLALIAAQSAWAAPEMIPETAMDEVGHTASDFTVDLREGGRFTLSEQKGKIVIISFWASWCTPCKKELPALSKLSEERKDLRFIAVNVDRERADAEKFLAALSSPVAPTLPIGFDNDAMALGGYSVTSMPTIFVIGKDGVTKYRKSGYSEERGFVEILAAADGKPIPTFDPPAPPAGAATPAAGAKKP